MSCAISPIDGLDTTLSGPYWRRKNPISKCFVPAVRRRFTVLAVQDGGYCLSDAEAPQNYAKYGASDDCVGGKGATSFPGFSPTRPSGGRVGENPGNEVGKGEHYANQVYKSGA